MLNPFQKNKIYKRRDIHLIYKGNWQSGISISGTFPYIFIFTGSSGHQHGYKDRWENSDIFSYTGEGQVGDMEFTRGNLALRQHVENGKRVFLFRQIGNGQVIFEDEMQFHDVGFFTTKDRNGNDRIGIKFFFKRLESDYVLKDQTSLEMYSAPDVTERKGLVTSRVGQGAYRKSILYRYDFKCAVTQYKKKEILIASHIVPWSEVNDTERLDVNNGILLSPTYDALFDQNLISFENTGKIILSDSLQKTNFELIGITGNERIKNFATDNYSYLERHRELLIN